MVAHSCEQVLCLIASWVFYHCQICSKPSTNHNRENQLLPFLFSWSSANDGNTGAREKQLHQLSFQCSQNKHNLVKYQPFYVPGFNYPKFFQDNCTDFHETVWNEICLSCIDLVRFWYQSFVGCIKQVCLTKQISFLWKNLYKIIVILLNVWEISTVTILVLEISLWKGF